MASERYKQERDDNSWQIGNALIEGSSFMQITHYIALKKKQLWNQALDGHQFS